MTKMLFLNGDIFLGHYALEEKGLGNLETDDPSPNLYFARLTADEHDILKRTLAMYFTDSSFVTIDQDPRPVSIIDITFSKMNNDHLYDVEIELGFPILQIPIPPLPPAWLSEEGIKQARELLYAAFGLDLTDNDHT